MEPRELPETAGDVEVWWIPRPAPPRVPVRTALLVGTVLLLFCSGMAAWSVALSGDASDLWPWSIGPINGAQIALRYLSILLVAWLYIVARSLPAWVRAIRQARRDLGDTQAFIGRGRWKEAARVLHRYCLMQQEVWGRLPARVATLDAAIRPHLDARRRLYVYYTGGPPPLPDTPTAGFAPRVVPAALVGWWTMLIFVALAATTYAELTGVLRSQQWRMLRAANFVILAGCLGAYAYVYLITALGRQHYFRFAPGVAELLTFGVFRTRARVQAIHLRESDTVLDLTGSAVVLATFRPERRRGMQSHHLAKRPEVVEACLRAVLSTAPMHAMPDARLVD